MHSILQKISDIVFINDAASKCLPTFITSDSRKVSNGAMFIAVKGAASDGSQFISSAISNGASIIVSEAPPPQVLNNDIGYIQVKDSRRAVYQIASNWYARQPEYVVAVTGTDGKTSTADFFRQICTLAGKKSVSIGTLGVIGSIREYPALNTTPDPILLHEMLSELAGESVTHASLEASSHGLDQFRLHGARIHTAAFTNLTRDHLDYHGTMEAYFAAKLKLFTEVMEPGGTAIINADSSYFEPIAHAVKTRGATVLSYGKSGHDFVILNMHPSDTGIAVQSKILGNTRDFILPMIGSFQVYNFLAALGMATACGISVDKTLENIHLLKGVSGRLEQVAAHPVNGANIYIDYAHTPAALENILKLVRPHVQNKLHVVFGCGGDRDKGKRPQMGLAALQYADAVIVTDDNPRNENPESIRAEILKPLSGEQLQNLKTIADRKEAIAFAIHSLQKGDGLVIAGKGHERSQIIAGKSYPFDDAEVARNVVQEIKG